MSADTHQPRYRSNAHTLVIGPWEGHGGIASVMRMHRMTDAWTNMQCRELSTFREGNRLEKIAAALKAYLLAPILTARAKLLHVHLAGSMSCLRKLPFIACGRLLRKPVIVHLHAAEASSLKRPGFGWAVKSAFRMATRVVALSSSWEREIRAIAGDVPVVIIPNPVRIFPVLERQPGIVSRPVILFSGKLEPRKGYRLLLQAAQQLTQEFPDLQVWLAGNGETKEATELAEGLGIKSSVRILGWLAPASIDALLRAATVFCLPSFNEGVPMAVLEAMSHSLPVVTTPVGGLPELITHGKNGMFAEVGDVESLRANLSLLLRDAALRNDMGRRARITVTRECGLDRVSHALESLYQDVLDQPHKKNANPKLRNTGSAKAPHVSPFPVPVNKEQKL